MARTAVNAVVASPCQASSASDGAHQASRSLLYKIQTHTP